MGIYDKYPIHNPYNKYPTYDSLPRAMKRLAEMGYRLVSRKHRTISRVNRSDWREVMAKRLCPWDEIEGLMLVDRMGEASAADWYRRCISKDTLTISSWYIKAFPKSGNDPINYVKGE